MRKLSILLISFFCSYPQLVLSQIQEGAIRVLASKNFLSFQTFTDSFPIQNPGSRHWTILRDLSPGFREGVFYFNEFGPKANDGSQRVFVFRVQLITHGNEIVHYYFGEKRSKKIKKEWVPYYDTLAHFRNDSLYTLLLSSFQNTYGGELKESELFVDNIAYGHSCGNGGMDPQEKVTIDRLAEANNKEELFNWLRSTNFEKQIYGLEGLYTLKEKGTVFTNEELRLIKTVLMKRGTIYSCRGCVFRWTDVLRVTYRFKFE